MSPATRALVRPATDGDVQALAEVHVRTWQVAYRGVIPDAFLDALRVEDRVARWRQILSEDTRSVAVCELDGRIVGFVSVSRSRDADAGPDTGELVALYVDPDAWHCGLGRRLMAWAKDVARARGWPRMTLWVLRDNPQARRFYEAAGFRTDGATMEGRFGEAAVTEVRYVQSGDA